MPPSEHSKLGASSYARWKACPGSVALSEGVPRHPTIYAAEGTLAHKLAEQSLRRGRDPHEAVGAVDNIDGFDLSVTKEMADAVAEYVDFIRELEKHGAKVELEKKLSLTSIHPALFGTADCVAIMPDDGLVIVDYKHGAGVRVEVEGNSQLRAYAAYAAAAMDSVPEYVEVVIVQPRSFEDGDSIRRWRFDALELLPVMAGLKKDAMATEQPDAPLSAGEHCKFCPAKALCPKTTEVANAAAAEVFAPVTEPGRLDYSPEAMGRRLSIIPRLKSYIEAVEEFALAEANAGRIPVGYELTPTRATRKWNNEVEVKKRIPEMFGIPEEDLYDEPKMLSPAKLEKLPEVKKRKEELAEFYSSVSSGVKLQPVPEGRAPTCIAAKVFKTVENKESEKDNG